MSIIVNLKKGIKLLKCFIDNNTNAMLKYKILTKRYLYAIILGKAGGAANVDSWRQGRLSNAWSRRY